MNSERQPWQPQLVLIANREVCDAISLAKANGWPMAPSPVNAALVAYLAIEKVLYENTL